jgi:hypothetical protein
MKEILGFLGLANMEIMIQWEMDPMLRPTSVPGSVGEFEMASEMWPL